MTDATHRNGNIRWLIGLALTTAVALAGWTYAGAKAAEVRGIGEVRTTAIEAKNLSVQNDRQIAVLQSQLLSFSTTLQEIKTLLKEHEERNR
jgi:hypothetical protein